MESKPDHKRPPGIPYKEYITRVMNALRSYDSLRYETNDKGGQFCPVNPSEYSVFDDDDMTS